MTDAARTQTVPRGLSGTTESLRDAVVRVAAVARDRTVFESAALLIPIVLVGATHATGPLLWLVAVGYLVASAWLAVRAHVRGGAAGWNEARILLAVGMVAAGQLLTGTTGLLSVVYLPIIALAAFGSPRLLVIALVASVLAHVTAETIERGVLLEAVERALGFASAARLVAFGTRGEVQRLERARDRLRRAVRSDRRRARQIAGIEGIGRILAAQGPTATAFHEVVERISSEFGFRYVSIYLGTNRRATLVAQRGYTELIESFDGERGIVGRVMRTQRPVLLADVSRDPDYWVLNPDVTSEICAPMLAGGEFLGFVNVESTDRRLDTTDLRLMTTIADRLAAALIIGRERQRIGERADLFRHLHEFSEAVSSTLQADELHQAIARCASLVVPADVVTLHLLDPERGRYLLRAVEGNSYLSVGTEVRTGEGLPGRAIRDRTTILDDATPQPPTLRTVAAGFLAEEPPPPPMLGASIPLVRDGAVLGALTLMRRDRAHRFSELERDALAMLAQQAVLAVTNVSLHAEVAELAMRDPLTGLFNRRYLDPALRQLFARQARLPVEERVPIAAIMFDLDHFSQLNNRHGHQVGDAVLRAFGDILRSRMRTTDLVGRFGGEEFAAILYRATLDDAMRIADEVREHLASTAILGSDGEELHASVSAGCAIVGPDQESPEELLRAADVALYMAKRAGRDRVCAA
jgi:diguanylate cyclase (GGDEF)-like protein